MDDSSQTADEASWAEDPVVARGLIDGVRAISAAVLVVMAIFSTVELIVGDRGYGWHEGLLDLVTAAAAIANAAWMGTQSRDGWRRAHRAFSILVAVAVVNVVVTAVAFDYPDNLQFLAFIVIGAGAVSLSRGPYYLAGALSLGGVGAASLEAGEPMLDAAIAICAAIVTGWVILRSRRLQVAQAVAMRRSEAARARELQEALDRLATELEERERAEAERLRLTEAQTKLREELADSRRLEALGTLAGGVAHDMNNVLAAISSVAEAALAEPSLSAQQREDMLQIDAAATQGAALTRNLLGFARRGKRRDQRVDVTAMVQDAVSLLRRTLPKGLVLRTEAERDLPRVRGDMGQLGHVVINLCVNARDATDGEGHIDVRVQAVDLDDDPVLAKGRYVELTVRDDGAGMSEETMSQVFEPFFSTKSTGDHAGLGLSMVYGTIRQHGGDVRLESVVGQGTTVRILLPAAAAPEPLFADTPSNVRSKPPTGLRVMVVDDEPLVRSGARRLLRMLGADVSLAKGGAEAVTRMETGQRFDLVLLDMAMPEMAGTATFHALRAIDPDVQILIVSGYPKGADIEALIEAGAIGFLDKPYNRESLSDVLRTLGGGWDRAKSEPVAAG